MCFSLYPGTIDSSETLKILLNVNDLVGRRAKFLDAITDCTAFVNFRFTGEGGKAVLALSYFRKVR